MKSPQLDKHVSILTQFPSVYDTELEIALEWLVYLLPFPPNDTRPLEVHRSALAVEAAGVATASVVTAALNAQYDQDRVLGTLFALFHLVFTNS